MLRLLLSEKEKSLKEQMHRDAFDNLGCGYKTDYQGAMDEAEWSAIQNIQSLGLKLIDKRQQELKMLKTASNKLEEGTYGICEECGDDISEQRLTAVFYAIYCLVCAERSERKKN